MGFLLQVQKFGFALERLANLADPFLFLGPHTVKIFDLMPTSVFHQLLHRDDFSPLLAHLFRWRQASDEGSSVLPDLLLFSNDGAHLRSILPEWLFRQITTNRLAEVHQAFHFFVSSSNFSHKASFLLLDGLDHLVLNF